MTIYAIGDVQGCYDDLVRLLDKLKFDPANDQLWLAGDLVNRGPKSLETLRFIRHLGECAVSVLGNHDLHLLAVACKGEKQKKKDTFEDILNSPDREELLDWLRHRPLIHHDAEFEFTLVHAGIHPGWDLPTARALAKEVENQLQSHDRSEFFKHMYGNYPEQWSDELKGWDRLRFITNIFTRLRYCDNDGKPDFGPKGPPGTQATGLCPWFEIQTRKTRNEKIIFGHWSTLGSGEPANVYPLDTGCVWGGRLTALAISIAGTQYVDVACAGAQQPTGRW